MNPVIQAYSICIQAGQPVLLWGEPGVGKTMITHAIARSLKFSLIEQICSTWDPTDVGLPMIDKSNPIVNSGEYHKDDIERAKLSSESGWPDGTAFTEEERVMFFRDCLKELKEARTLERASFFSRVPPKWAMDCCKISDSGGGVLLYLDEYSCTPPAVQAATLKIVGERKCGDLQLPDSLSIAASANPADQAAGGWDLAPPAANRWCHLEYALNVDEWCEGMLSGFPDPVITKLPKGWKSLIPSKRVLISSYIKRFGKEHLLNCPDDEASAGRAWPSPRSWDSCARLLAAAETIGADSAVVLHLVKGMVGNPAISFLTFIENLDLPDPEILLQDPSLYEHPSRGDKAHVVLGSVVAAVLQKNTIKRWESAIDIICSAARQGGTDIACLPARTLLKNKASGADVKNEIIDLFPTLQAAGLVGGE